MAGALLAIGAVCIPGPAAAQDMKELMGKAQTQAEQRAVEELVKKLQGGPNKNPAPAAKGQSAIPAAAAPVPQVSAPQVPDPQVAAPSGEPNRPARIELPAGPEIATPSPVVTPQTGSDPFQPIPPAPVARPVPVPPVASPAQVEPPPIDARPVARPPAQTPPVEIARPASMPSVDIEVYFDYNSAVVTEKAASTLSILGRALVDPRLAGAKFLIGGHTDAKGSAAFNLELSGRRAAAVRLFLIERFQIEPERLVSRGYGHQQLKLPGRPMALENRRVQIVNLSVGLSR